jgi:hypothetical protein
VESEDSETGKPYYQWNLKRDAQITAPQDITATERLPKRRAGAGGVSSTLPEESPFAEHAISEDHAKNTNDSDMGHGGKAWLNTDGTFVPQDKVHEDLTGNLYRGNIRIGNLEGNGPVLFHAEGRPTEAQRAAIGKDISKQGVIYDLTHQGQRVSGETENPGEFWRAVDQHYGDSESPKVSPVHSAIAKAAGTKGEGFTFNPKTGETPTTGHMVETIPEAGKSFEHPPTADEIRRYVADNKETLDKHPELHVGGYRNTLGISGRYGDEATADAAARKLDQISRYDLEKGKEVETGGTGKTTSFPDYPIEQRLADLSKKTKSEYHPDLQKMVDKFGAHSDPGKAASAGASFVTPDGKFITLPAGVTHDSALTASGIKEDASDARVPFLTKTGVVRIRFNPTDRSGPTLHFSVPEKGVTPYQIDSLKQAVARNGRNGNVVLERADISPDTENLVTTKEFARPSDVEPMLRQIQAHPEQTGLNTAELKSPKGSSVPLMENPLKVKGTSEEGKVNTLDVAKALSQYTKKKIGALELGKAEPAEQVERAKSLAEDEAKYQLHQNNSGKAWYTTDIGVHDNVLQRLRPELKDPAKLSLFKMAEAVLSSGQKPYQNLKAAVKAWDHYNETGEFPATNPNTGKSWGPRGVAAYGNALESINKLIQEKGEKGASEWLLSEHPVSELRQYNRMGVSGKQTDTQLGAMILGAKRGPFAQNLHGIESAFTADMWVSRTWNRWMGTTEVDPEAGKYGEATTDAPKNNTERKLMSQSFEETAKKLNLTTSSLQAILWYYEQGLYDVHGAKKESWSFADAAKRIEKEHGEADKQQEQGNMFGENAPPPKPTAPAGQVHALDFMKLLGGGKK